MRKIISFTILGLLICSACVNKVDQTANIDEAKLKESERKVPLKIKKFIDEVEPFFEKLGKPKANEWLSRFNEEGQTFKEYYNDDPFFLQRKDKSFIFNPLAILTRPR